MFQILNLFRLRSTHSMVIGELDNLTTKIITLLDSIFLARFLVCCTSDQVTVDAF
jgi:hypothetical protein